MGRFFSFYFCSFLGSLFDHCLTNVWTTFGCLFGCLLGAFSGLLRFSWKPLDPKTLKNGRFFKVFENAAFWLFELLMALLGSSCPLFGRSGPKMNPKNSPNMLQKRNLNCQCFCFFFKMKLNQRSFQLRPVLEPKLDQHFCTK